MIALTLSNIERRNEMNNRYAIKVLHNNGRFVGVFYEDDHLYIKKAKIDLYEFNVSKIGILLSQYPEELKESEKTKQFTPNIETIGEKIFAMS